MKIKELITEADEWEESSEKWHRFQRWSIDQMMRSPERTATGNHVSELENKTFGHPITYDTGAGIVSQQPFGAVQTNIGAGRKWTAWVKSIMDNYQEYEAQWKADSAAGLVDNQQYKEFLDRAYKDFISMGENSYEQREQHAIALSGYQVKYFGGKLFGSLGGNIKGARASMTPEIFGVLEKAEAYLVQKNIIDYDNKRNAELLRFWEMLPYPIKLMVAAAMGKTPAQVEAILKTSGKSDTEIMGAYLNASEPSKPETQKESTIPRQQGDRMPVTKEYWQKAVLARYPTARFVHEKMINGAIYAMDNSGQVGSYEPKRSYAKVGPESLKTESASPLRNKVNHLRKK